jgi:hypothetical protein
LFGAETMQENICSYAKITRHISIITFYGLRMGGQTRVDELDLGLARAAINFSNETIFSTFEDMDRTIPTTP